MNKKITLLIVALSLFIKLTNAQQISVTALSQVYTQNFNTLETTGTTGTTMPNGWYFNGVSSYRANNGSTTNGALYSFGDTAVASITDRSIGSIGSNSIQPSFGAKFINNTTASITDIIISFNIENWRLGQKPALRLDSTEFSYNIGVDSFNSVGWISVNSLNLITPDTSATSSGALNGNLAINKKAVSGTISGLAIEAGKTFWIRWKEINVSGADDGLSVDDLTVKFAGGVVPACTEPAASVPGVSLITTGTTSISGSFVGTSPASDGYLVLLDNNATVPTITDATTYTVGQIVGTATVISYGASTSFSANSLVPNTNYKVYVFPYNNSGCTGGPNYKTTSPANANTTTLVDACPEPTAKPTNLVFSLVDNTTIKGKFNKSIPAPTGGYVVVFSTSSSMGYPNDTTSYSIGDSIKNGSAKSKVAYVGTDSVFTISSLVSGIKYYVAVIPYNTCPYGPNYFRTSPLKDDTTTTGGVPVCVEPDTITGITVTERTNNSIKFTFTPNSNAPNGYLVVYRKNSSFLLGVDDGTTYTVGQLLTQTSGSFIDSSYVGYIGTNTTITLTGLDLGSTYNIAVFPFNNTGCSGGPNYKVKFTNNVNKTTATTTGGVCAAPNSVPQNLVFSSVTSTSISGHFKQLTTADGYVVVIAKGFIASLTDNVNYNAGDSIGNSPRTYIIKTTTTNVDTNFVVNGLLPSTSYSVAIYPYKTCTSGKLYKNTIVPTVNKRDTITTFSSGIRNSNTEANFAIYPNPTNTGALFVRFNNNLKEEAVIEVMDILGQKISVQKIVSGNDLISVDVSNFAKGTYILNVVYKGENSVNTFIVQ